MTALTQYLSDLLGRGDGKKAGEARPDYEHCQLAFVGRCRLQQRSRSLAGQAVLTPSVPPRSRWCATVPLEVHAPPVYEDPYHRDEP
jgi:hypothetical protein